MVIWINLALALALGYLVAVAFSLALTFWITAAMPRLVLRGSRLTPFYKSAQDLVWLVCACGGGYVAATVGGSIFPWLAASVLVGWLIATLWVNGWEAQQRGMAHQITISAMTIAGVAAGYVLRFRTTTGA